MQETIKLAFIFPDPEQPRKYFDTVKLHRLKQSIAKYGIQSPLVVIKDSATHYTLVDGERRWRMATELGLKEVPVIITETSSQLDRLIKQFHIQEQHEGWTMTEKANAIIDLAASLKLPLADLCRELGIDRGEAERFISYAQLIEKQQFAKAELPMEQATRIRRLKESTRRVYQKATEEEFDRSMEKGLEKALMTRAEEGLLKSGRDYSKVRDSFTKDPRSIQKFIDDKTITPDSLFLKTKAQGAYSLRNAVSNARGVVNHLTDFLKIGDVAAREDDLKTMRAAKGKIEEFLGVVGE